MKILERAQVIHFHRTRITTHGADTVQALGWPTPESQQARFEVIASSADFTSSSVLDVGCGKGDLLSFLDARFTGVSYTGIEQIPEFLAVARSRFADRPSAHFRHEDFTTASLPESDHVVACGALGYHSAESGFVFNSITRLFGAARRTLIFNLLDAANPPRHPLLASYDVEEIAAHCRTLSPSAQVVRGYAPGDATYVVMRT